MTLETEIYNRLKNFGGLNALVQGRIYPVVLAQGCALPAICYQRISTTRESAMGVDTGDARARVQVTIYGSKYASQPGAVYAVRDQVLAALQRYRGGVIQDSFVDGELHDFLDDPKYYRIVVDFIIPYKE